MAAELLAFIDSGNTTHNLDGSSVSNPRHVAGRQGFYAPPIAQLDQRTPQQPGSIVRYTDILPRIITVPLLVKDPTGSEANFQTQMETMLDSWFASAGTFRSTKPSGTTRDLINCYYLGGMELDENLDSGIRGSGWAFVTPQFQTDPLWQDSTATTNNYTNTQLLAGISINNTGGYECWPVWTFAGPMTNLVMTNTTTGKAIKLTANGGLAIASGHTLVIDLSPGVKTLILDGTTAETNHLTLDSLMWPLAVGTNAITFSYTAGVNGTTTGQVSYKRRYRSL